MLPPACRRSATPWNTFSPGFSGIFAAAVEAVRLFALEPVAAIASATAATAKQP